MVKVGIAGGSGYGGAELLHILIRHPEVEIVWISSHRHNGQHVSEVYPSLRGFLDSRFTPLDTLYRSDLDVLFLALPNGQAMNIVPQLSEDLIIIDLSGDFRIGDADLFERYYKFSLAAPELQKDFVYVWPSSIELRFAPPSALPIRAASRRPPCSPCILFIRKNGSKVRFSSMRRQVRREVGAAPLRVLTTLVEVTACFHTNHFHTSICPRSFRSSTPRNTPWYSKPTRLRS